MLTVSVEALIVELEYVLMDEYKPVVGGVGDTYGGGGGIKCQGNWKPGRIGIFRACGVEIPVCVDLLFAAVEL